MQMDPVQDQNVDASLSVHVLNVSQIRSISDAIGRSLMARTRGTTTHISATMPSLQICIECTGTVNWSSRARTKDTTTRCYAIITRLYVSVCVRTCLYVSVRARTCPYVSVRVVKEAYHITRKCVTCGTTQLIIHFIS